MSARVSCVSNELWYDAVCKLEQRVLNLEKVFKCGKQVSHDENGVRMSPCTTQLWRRDVRMEHDEYTCYFRHWFKKVDGVLQVCKFSHLALMPLVRSCVWQGLLFEFVTGTLCGREAVRLRVEDELEHYSNLTSSQIRQSAGMLAQDFFNLVKNHLGAARTPLTRSGLGAAEKIVVSLPGLDYRNSRKGWSNRKLRKEIAQQIIDAGVASLPTRKEQEAFVWKWIGQNSDLKQSAPSAILRLLCNYCDVETGEVAIKPWSKSELSEIRKEARERGTAEKVMSRANAILDKIQKGEKLTAAERKFKCVHKDLFPQKSSSEAKESVTEQTPICKCKHSTDCLLFRNTKKPRNQTGNQKPNPFSSLGTYGEMVLIRNRRQKK